MSPSVPLGRVWHLVQVSSSFQKSEKLPLQQVSHLAKIRRRVWLEEPGVSCWTHVLPQTMTDSPGSFDVFGVDYSLPPSTPANYPFSNLSNMIREGESGEESEMDEGRGRKTDQLCNSAHFQNGRQQCHSIARAELNTTIGFRCRSLMVPETIEPESPIKLPIESIWEGRFRVRPLPLT